MDIDAEDSLALDARNLAPKAPVLDASGAKFPLDVVAIRWPFVANAGDLDPLRLEPGADVRWVRSPAELGRPDLVVLPGSKSTRADLDWFRASGMADVVERSGAAVVAICAGVQMAGRTIADPLGVEGPPGKATGLAWLPLTTTFAADKVLDRPAGTVVDGPGRGTPVAGYRIHHGRVDPADPVAPWIVADDGTTLGWHDGGRILGTTLHALFEDDGFRQALLQWVAARAGKRWERSPHVGFHAARISRLDRIADAIESHLDLDRLRAIVATARTPRSPLEAGRMEATSP